MELRGTAGIGTQSLDITNPTLCPSFLAFFNFLCPPPTFFPPFPSLVFLLEGLGMALFQFLSSLDFSRPRWGHGSSFFCTSLHYLEVDYTLVEAWKNCATNHTDSSTFFISVHQMLMSVPCCVPGPWAGRSLVRSIDLEVVSAQ